MFNISNKSYKIINSSINNLKNILKLVKSKNKKNNSEN